MDKTFQLFTQEINIYFKVIKTINEDNEVRKW